MMWDLIEFIKGYVLGGIWVLGGWLNVPRPQMTMEEMLAYPDPRPCNFDSSIEFWLDRISRWGRLHFWHIDPEFQGRRKVEVTRSEFVKKIRDPQLNEMFGVWHIELLAANKVRLYRDYHGLDGRRYREEFIVEIDLRPELQEALRGKGVKFNWKEKLKKFIGKNK